MSFDIFSNEMVPDVILPLSERKLKSYLYNQGIPTLVLTCPWLSPWRFTPFRSLDSDIDLPFWLHSAQVPL